MPCRIGEGPRQRGVRAGFRARLGEVQRPGEPLLGELPRRKFNWRTPLVCALAAAHLGDEREARRLEELGRESVIASP
jgi:hypothetical protein